MNDSVWGLRPVWLRLLINFLNYKFVRNKSEIRSKNNLIMVKKFNHEKTFKYYCSIPRFKNNCWNILRRPHAFGSICGTGNIRLHPLFFSFLISFSKYVDDIIDLHVLRGVSSLFLFDFILFFVFVILMSKLLILAFVILLSKLWVLTFLISLGKLLVLAGYFEITCCCELSVYSVLICCYSLLLPWTLSWNMSMSRTLPWLVWHFFTWSHRNFKLLILIKISENYSYGFK